MAVHPFSDLPKVTERLARNMTSGATKIMRKLAIGIGGTLVDTTRVDTGKARSNWRGTLNNPASGTIPPYAPGKRLGVGETANASAAKDQQAQVFLRFNAEKDRAIYITNNVHYIGILNHGRVGADGDGDFMVEQAVLVGRAILKTARLVERK